MTDRGKRQVWFTLPRGFDPTEFLPARLQTYADECRFLVSLIVVKTALKDVDQWGCVRLHNEILRKYIDANRIAPFVRALKEANTIEVFPHCAGIKAKGYRMTARWTCMPSVRVPCYDIRLRDRILAQREELAGAEKAEWQPVHHQLRRQQYGLTITDQAEQILDNLPAETRDAVTLSQSYLIDSFAAQQDCAGFSQFEWSTTWKEENGFFLPSRAFLDGQGQRVWLA